MHTEANRENKSLSKRMGDAAFLLFCRHQRQSCRCGAVSGPLLLVFVIDLILVVFMMPGFFSLQPNEARVLVLFGAYKGTVRSSGFHWGNPFYTNGPQGLQTPRKRLNQAQAENPAANRTLGRFKISLRARTLNGEPLKVNDRRGNPVEIAAVVVWRVQDTAQAVFDVDDYDNYVTTERVHCGICSRYPYDDGGDNEPTLRINVDEVSQALRQNFRTFGEPVYPLTKPA
jgi:hypothetical protein